MTDAELIAHHLATKGATVCTPGHAAGLSQWEKAAGMTAPPPIQGTFRDMQAKRVAKAMAAKGMIVKPKAPEPRRSGAME